jgi:hypothetical protein
MAKGEEALIRLVMICLMIRQGWLRDIHLNVMSCNHQMFLGCSCSAYASISCVFVPGAPPAFKE